MSSARAAVEASIFARLRDESGEWPAAERDQSFRDCVDYHGVRPLLSRGTRDLADDVAVELLRRIELIGVLRALAGAGVTPLILKGTALAYSIYPSPVLRPRADTDLLIRDTDRPDLERVLLALGYRKPNAVSGALVGFQCGYVRQDRFGVEHVLDVHWRVSNTQLFARALAYGELMARAQAIPALCAHARGLAHPDALLLACMHRAHHMHSPYHVGGVSRAGGDRLIWIYDIHLLVSAMSIRERVEFARLAENTGMRAICLDGLRRAQDCFGTTIPGRLHASLAGSGRREASASHLQAGGVRHFLTEARSLPGWRDRARWLGEHLFPPAAYMLEKYGTTRSAWLPMLYLQRGILGAWKRISNP